MYGGCGLVQCWDPALLFNNHSLISQKHTKGPTYLDPKCQGFVCKYKWVFSLCSFGGRCTIIGRACCICREAEYNH